MVEPNLINVYGLRCNDSDTMLFGSCYQSLYIYNRYIYSDKKKSVDAS